MAGGKGKKVPQGNQENLATPVPSSPNTANSGIANNPEEKDAPEIIPQDDDGDP